MTNLDQTWALDGDPPTTLRPVCEDDLEVLREQKNRNREFFFFQGEISPAMQKEWFRAFEARDDDWMFIIEVDREACGCIGVRHEGGVIDFYNLIMWNRGGCGLMSRALACLVGVATEAYPSSAVRVLVLRSNPAVRWYEGRGFTIQAAGLQQGLEYVELRYGSVGLTGVAHD
jgi:hypothetical protein